MLNKDIPALLAKYTTPEESRTSISILANSVCLFTIPDHGMEDNRFRSPDYVFIASTDDIKLEMIDLTFYDNSG